MEVFLCYSEWRRLFENVFEIISLVNTDEEYSRTKTIIIKIKKYNNTTHPYMCYP